jgi:hypothetical protein
MTHKETLQHTHVALIEILERDEESLEEIEFSAKAQGPSRSEDVTAIPFCLPRLLLYAFK